MTGRNIVSLQERGLNLTMLNLSASPAGYGPASGEVYGVANDR